MRARSSSGTGRRSGASQPLSSNRHVLTRATSSVRAHVSRMSRSRSLTVTETPVWRDVSSVSAWLCAASRRSLLRSSCCDASAASSSRLTAALSSDRSLPAPPSSSRAVQRSAWRISSARELTWFTRRMSRRRKTPATSSDTPTTSPPMNRTSSSNEGWRAPCHARSTRWKPTNPTMMVMMTAMRVFSMRGRGTISRTRRTPF